ncbi:RNA-directed DNA polymerase, eukaryota [Tanacetum coccineum]
MYLVLPSLISEVQSAFVSNRQILDGSFILNELLSWYSLKAFGFGQKWCKWIHGCLDRDMGSVLVNGSPTSEFQFHKGLKQGDPLSPFLFILIMESLHLSFKRVIDAGFYKGISLSASFMISHLFYADDAVFVGEWSSSNIITIANVLKCFYLASGLKINFHKSKLMGVGVNLDEVNRAASMVGCSTFTSPFKYLGVKVGGNMSRISSWDEVINKVSTRLSKWKLKTLSIGGRLTLIKSVLTSIPLYHMSIFKVLLGVLNKLEAIRRNFFNGVECSEKRLHGLVGIRKKVGNGENTSFWDENWLGDDIFKSIYPRLPRGGVEKVQLDSLRTRTSVVTLPNMVDRWI